MGAERWVAERLPSDVRHLDVAACGRVSRATVDAQLRHLQAEGGGGYRAEALAEQELRAGRAALAAMVARDGADVAFLESASDAFRALLAAWPLPAGARIGTVASEYGPNAMVLRELAATRRWVLVELPVDRWGRISDLPGDLDLLTFPHVPSQRGVCQPVEQVLHHDVPLVLDVAQSLGQTPVPPGAAAYVGTSRKWLCGPRGVGFLLVHPSWQPRLSSPPTAAQFLHSGVRRLESMEAHVAGRVGLATAVAEWAPDLLPLVHRRARELREALTATPWHVREPVEEPTGITTLSAPEGVDPVAVRAALLAEGVLTTAVPATRAADLTAPVLRLSTAAWVTEEDVAAAVAALGRATS